MISVVEEGQLSGSAAQAVKGDGADEPAVDVPLQRLNGETAQIGGALARPRFGGKSGH